LDGYDSREESSACGKEQERTPEVKWLRIFLSIVHWFLLINAFFVILTGLGITEFRLMEVLTLGLLGKAETFRLHFVLWIQFLFLLFFHTIGTVCLRRWFRAR
jgi:hypothetical protein